MRVRLLNYEYQKKKTKKVFFYIFFSKKFFFFKRNVAYHTRTYASVRIHPPNWTYANIRNYARKRGRPAGSKNKKANQREKSLFEYSIGRKCSKFGQAGHNARTCEMRESEI